MIDDIPIFVTPAVFFVIVTFDGTVTVPLTVVMFELSGCGNCGRWARCGWAAALQYSVVTSLVVTSSLLITSCQPLFESNSSPGLPHTSYSFALSSSDLLESIEEERNKKILHKLIHTNIETSTVPLRKID